MFKQLCAGVALLVVSAAAQATVVIDLTGSGGNLGPTETFYGDNGVELTVAAFATRNPINIADPFVTDNIRQNGNGIGTQIGANGIGNDNANFFAQVLSFGVNKGRIVGIEITGFRHGNRNRLGEELSLFSTMTIEPPTVGQIPEFLAFLEAVPGNPDFFDVPSYSGDFVQVVSSLIDFPTNARISAIHVAEPGVLGLLGVSALVLLIRRRRRY